MSKGYIFNIPAHGHINPSLPLTRELVRRGEQITYFTGASEQAKIASTGAEFRALPYDLSSFSKSPKSPEIIRADQPVSVALMTGGHADNRGVEMGATEGAVEIRGEAVNATIGTDDPITVGGITSHADYVDDVDARARNGTLERRIAKRKNPAVFGHEPVTIAGGGAAHADNRLIEMDAAFGTVKTGGSIGKDAAVRTDQPISVALRTSGHADDGRVQMLPAHRAVELRVAERKDSAVRCRDPIAETIRGRNHRHAIGEVMGGAGGEIRRDGSAVDHIAIDAAGNAGNGSAIGVLPDVPNSGTPDFATGAGRPRRAGLAALTVVIRDIGEPLCHARVEVTCGTGAGVDDGFDRDTGEGGVVLDIKTPLVSPIGQAAGTHMAAEDFKIQHRGKTFAIGRDLGTGHTPEMTGFGCGRVAFWMGKVVGAHRDSGRFAARHVAAKSGVGHGGALGGFGPRERDAGSFYAGPIHAGSLK